MSKIYLIKEAFRGFKHAKISSFASVITVAISLILFSVYFSFTINSNKIIKSIKDKVEIEVFFRDDIKNEEINLIKEKIKTIGGVKSFVYVSKEDAAKIFEKEFGKEMLEVYDYNPLPASLKINMYDEYKTTERLNKVKSQIASLPKVDDIVFPEKNLELIEKNTSGIIRLNLIIMILISISSIFFVSNTIRLIINSRKKIIDTLRLCGATKSFIILPYIIEGFIQGIAGAFVAIGFLFILNKYFISKLNNNDIKIELFGNDFYFYLFSAGILLGTIGSYFSVRKFLKIQTN